WLTAAVIVFGLFRAGPAPAQVPVMAAPSTYVTVNNKTEDYAFGTPISYSSDADKYVDPKLVRGVPDNLYSYIVTQGETECEGERSTTCFLLSTVRTEAMAGPPRVPAMPWNLTIPAGEDNKSL